MAFPCRLNYTAPGIIADVCAYRLRARVSHLTRRIRVASLRGEAKFHRDLPGAAPPADMNPALIHCASALGAFPVEGCRSRTAFLYLSLSLSLSLSVSVSLSRALFDFGELPIDRQTLCGEAGPSKCVPINLSRRTSGVCVHPLHLKRAKSLDLNGTLPPRDAPDRFQIDQRFKRATPRVLWEREREREGGSRGMLIRFTEACVTQQSVLSASQLIKRQVLRVCLLQSHESHTNVTLVERTQCRNDSQSHIAH